jgi:hypothetical protein
MRKPRKNYTPPEKVAILRRHLIDRVPVSALTQHSCHQGQTETRTFRIQGKRRSEGCRIERSAAGHDLESGLIS